MKINNLCFVLSVAFFSLFQSHSYLSASELTQKKLNLYLQLHREYRDHYSMSEEKLWKRLRQDLEDTKNSLRKISAVDLKKMSNESQKTYHRILEIQLNDIPPHHLRSHVLNREARFLRSLAKDLGIVNGTNSLSTDVMDLEDYFTSDDPFTKFAYVIASALFFAPKLVIVVLGGVAGAVTYPFSGGATVFESFQMY